MRASKPFSGRKVRGSGCVITSKQMHNSFRLEDEWIWNLCVELSCGDIGLLVFISESRDWSLLRPLSLVICRENFLFCLLFFGTKTSHCCRPAVVNSALITWTSQRGRQRQKRPRPNEFSRELQRSLCWTQQSAQVQRDQFTFCSPNQTFFHFFC